eukprot:gnl/TRDRNA2_/TRDRNA2_147517_c0_seq1.p1 gnl/TRDRNA2_/TRDRNA2_147517_c0~~gnl/TRDRNA2_/TRDRNA2_147517_c0_seq1.p1  ORF type:complete len:100 (-),score=8.28 gnl/TRDRNA2_/TRDRNA2_147517_c0_seq1:131-430(-)
MACATFCATATALFAVARSCGRNRKPLAACLAASSVAKAAASAFCRTARGLSAEFGDDGTDGFDMACTVTFKISMLSLKHAAVFHAQACGGRRKCRLGT